MNSLPTICAELTFLTPEEGGRQNLPSIGRYVPHAVVDGSSEYLGVSIDVASEIVAGRKEQFQLACMYKEVDYNTLQPGVAFTIREGSRIVARGRVLKLC